MTGVLKREKIRQGHAAPPTAPTAPAVQEAPAGRPGTEPAGQGSATVLEVSDGQALIEVTCPCGQKILVRCEYEMPTPA